MTSPPAGIPTVAVRGSWTAEVPPEVARVQVAVGARSAERAQALRGVAQRVEEVRAALTGYGAAVESVESSALWVRPQFKDRRPTERVTGHVAGLQLTATLVDFTVLGDLLLRLADREMVALQGPFWALRPDSDRYRQARTEAVRDARRRAEEYAAAVGSRLIGLIEIADTGMSMPDSAPMAMTGAALFAKSARDSVADEISFEVEPAPQTVFASVEARFTLTQPDFG
jgi:uncharacterized protein